MARIAVIPEKIIELLKKTHLLTANQMLKKLEVNGDSFNKTSVYRALDKLLESGEICKQSFGDLEAVYELRSDHHDHAVCNNCEKIIAVDCHSHSTKKVPGFTVDHHHTTIYGVCDSCSK